MLLKHYLDQGVSKAELSRRFGVNRRTIHHWIETGQLDRDFEAGAREYSPRLPVMHKLDPYKAIIDARLEAFPKLSANRSSSRRIAAFIASSEKKVSRRSASRMRDWTAPTQASTSPLLEDGLEAVEAACAEALESGACSADVVLNILARRCQPAPVPVPVPVPDIPTPESLQLRHRPAADCRRYDCLRRVGHGAA